MMLLSRKGDFIFDVDFTKRQGFPSQKPCHRGDHMHVVPDFVNNIYFRFDQAEGFNEIPYRTT